MATEIFNDGPQTIILGQEAKQTYNNNKFRKSRSELLQSESTVSNLLLPFVRFVLFIYGIMSFPIYYLIQRPDWQAHEAQQSRSKRVDIDTCIKTKASPNKTRHLSLQSPVDSSDKSPRRLAHNFLGSTMSEIFVSAIKEFSTKPCLGYRAVVTCPPVVASNEGSQSIERNSFRSDYTWYTYEQVGHRVQDIASGLYHHSVGPGSRAMFMASMSLEWFCASQACFQLNAQLVVAPEMEDIESLKLILEEAEVNIIFVSCDRLGRLCQLFACIEADANQAIYHTKRVVLIDWLFLTDFGEPFVAELGYASKFIKEKVLSMGQIEEAGVENPIELLCSSFLDREQPKGTKLESNLRIDEAHDHNNRSSKLKDPAPTDLPSPRRRHPLPEPTVNQGAKMILRDLLEHENDSKNLMLDETFDDDDDGIKLMNFSSFEPKPSDLAMIVYTKSPIGRQVKALKLSHSYLARCNYDLSLEGLVQENGIYCATLPSENFIEFTMEMCIFSHGGSIGYSCNPNTLFYDGKELFEGDKSDLEALKPTFLLVRPYILELLRASIQTYLSLQSNAFLSFVHRNVLYDYKKFCAQRNFGTLIVDYVFCSDLKRLFGGNLRYIICNGATDRPETRDFFAFMLNVPIIELYGPNEDIVSPMAVRDMFDHKRSKWTRNKDHNASLQDYEEVRRSSIETIGKMFCL